MTTPDPSKCPKCGQPIPQDAPRSLCPKCVLMGAVTPEEPSVTSSGRHSAPPSVEEIAPHFPSWKSSNSSVPAAWARFTRPASRSSIASSR